MSTLATARPAPPTVQRRLSRLDADARVDRGVRLAAAVALWLGLLLVTYWWETGGGVSDLAHGESGLTSVGRLTGLWSADLLLVQVLLMSRLPPLEHAFGRDRLARIHRVIGFLSFDLMVVHVLTIILGYAAGRWSAVPATTWDLITNYGGVLLSVAGTACLVMVVVTSVKAARRRLRYESWHLIHLYAYLGVGLALPHQLWTGQEFLGSTGATLYWWTLWATAVVAVLAWRVGLPVWRSLRHRLRVTSVVRESSDVVSVYLTGQRLDRLPVRAGQFLNLRFLDGPGWTRANPFSLSAAPDGRSLRVTAKALGAGSGRLATFSPGPGCCSRDPMDASASVPGADDASSWPAPAWGSPRSGRWSKAWTTRRVTRSCCTATPTTRFSPASCRSSPPRPASTSSPCPDRDRRRLRSSGR